ncbi:MFS transporter [Taibaiella lutea]|uniref:MFS transporter n=1 Tax=Taibaiella lutea TaxID=2608001 RepID=A0A5M6CDV6_9BACT|nr:MFS transporter [Taibaiella lutea]KAA5533306.1 MFS transporter [Taibaiella lutea]
MQTENTNSKNVWLLVIVASLGYFVDIYDLLLFAIVRVKSLTDIGVLAERTRETGEFVMNIQMAGLLIGGILWGIIGDKFGRIKVLFGSILLYSIANVINGFVQDVPSYAIIRFIAGIGLAGELGAGITLVSETMSKDKRGYGTMVVAVVGVLGAVAANLVAKHYNWRTAYFVGGGLGFLLLLLRMGTFESGMFTHVKESSVVRGGFKLIFNSKERFLKYLYCILVGIPLWYVIGILIAQSPEIGKAIGAKETLTAGAGIMYSYIGISVGDLLASLFAQLTKSRRLTIFVFLLLSLGTVIFYLNYKGLTENSFIWISFVMGLGVGYWATFVTIASEQFGTNIRATVTTTAPNFVRGSLIPITFVFEFFNKHFGIINACYIVMILVTVISLFALSQLKETFNKDLDYLEE